MLICCTPDGLATPVVVGCGWCIGDDAALALAVVAGELAAGVEAAEAGFDCCGGSCCCCACGTCLLLIPSRILNCAGSKSCSARAKNSFGETTFV